MRARLRWFRLAPLAALLLAAPPAAMVAPACTICVFPGSGLALPDPRILQVAIATRQAVESGVIPEAAVVGEASVLAQAPDANLIKLWVRTEKAVGLSTDGPVHVVLVDTDRRFALSPGPQGLSISTDTSGLSVRQIITTRKTLLALLNRALAWEKAREHGVLLVESIGMKDALEINAATASP